MLTGSGVIEPGQAALTLGTGAQLSVVSAKPAGSIYLNTFCHALPNLWYVMGALLAGAYALTWWQQIVNRPVERILADAAEAPPGCEGLLFRPHLNGERAPGMMGTKASFAHLTARHDAHHMSRAVLEGVAFALGDCLLNLRRVDVHPASIIFGGGGAKSDLWGQIIASTFNLPLTRLQGDEQTALGAAMLAAIGTGHFADFDEATRAWVRVADVIEPVAEWVPIYEEYFGKFRDALVDHVTKPRR
jgi:xylulokinase